MSESMMECSQCGKPFSTRFQELDENGNPICPTCFRKEQNAKDKEEKHYLHSYSLSAYGGVFCAILFKYYSVDIFQKHSHMDTL